MPDSFNVTLNDATQASAAAPIYFDPKIVGDMVLIDGALIANDPSLLAFIHARYNLKKPKIRIVSIGTGLDLISEISANTTSLITWITELTAFLVSLKQTSHEYVVQYMADDYYRYCPILNQSFSIDDIEPS